MALKKLLSDLTQGLAAYPYTTTPASSGGFNYGGSTSIADTKFFRQRSIPSNIGGTSQDNPSPLIPQLLPSINETFENSILYLNDSPDGFIRGGTQNVITRTAFDMIRINRFLLTDKGLVFTNTQKSLQKTNPIIQEGSSGMNGFMDDMLTHYVGSNMGLGGSLTNRTYRTDNLISQVSHVALGIYSNRAGDTPGIQTNDDYKYMSQHKSGKNYDADIIGAFSKISGLDTGNRLLGLASKLQTGLGGITINNPSSIMSQEMGFDIGSIINLYDTVKDGWNNLKTDPLGSLSGKYLPENILYEYNGGPDSIYGIGDTVLYRYSNTHFDNALYWENQIYTPSPSREELSQKDQLFNTINNNFFGGNDILGKDSIFTDNGQFTLQSALTGLGNRVIGEDATNQLSNLFGEGGIGSFKDIFSDDTITIQDPDGTLYFSDGASYQDGMLKKGFISSNTNINPTSTKTSIEKYREGNENETLPQGSKRKQFTVLESDKPKYTPNPTTDAALGSVILGSDHYYTKVLAKTVSGDSNGYHRENRINLGDPGRMGAMRGKDGTTDYTIGVDKLNSLDIHETTSETSFNQPKYRDLVRFRFDAIRTDNPSISDSIVFRAFLDDFGDNYSANWNSFKYSGRGEEFYTYNSFKRTFSFSFKIAAQSAAEMKPLYRKLNFLASTLAPDYGENGRMRGNYVKLTMGAYMSRTPGFITSLNIKWQKDYPWEITIDSPEGGVSKELHVLPHMLDVSCQFTPIHNFVPQKSIESSPFIIPGADDPISLTNGGARKWLSGVDPVSVAPKKEEKETEKEIEEVVEETSGTNSSTTFTPTYQGVGGGGSPQVPLGPTELY